MKKEQNITKNICSQDCYMVDKKGYKFDYVPILSGVVIFGMTFLLVYFLIIRGSDYNFHINEAQKIAFSNFYNSLKSTVIFTNPLWHILVALCSRIFKMNYLYAAAFITASFNLGLYLILRVGINKYCVKLKNTEKNLIAIMLMFVTAIYLPWFNQHLYLGQGSPTIWHNPTNMAVKPIALLIVFLVINQYNSYVKNKLENRNMILIGMILFISVLIKPSFIQIFFPGILMFCCIKFFFVKEIEYAFVKKVFLLLLPSLIFLVFQFISIFMTNTTGQGRGIELSWFKFWKLYSPNILISHLISMAFPLYILVFRKNILKENMLLLSICLYVVGFLQAAFLYDRGVSGSAGDYVWGYQLAQFIIFSVSTILFFNDLSYYTQQLSCRKTDLYFFCGFSLLFLHFVSGVYYYFFLLFVAKGQLQRIIY